MPTLGPLFTKPLHVARWTRPLFPLSGWNHYRVTNSYTGVDLINGGLHRATDAGNKSRWSPLGGNTGKGEVVIAPTSCRASGLRHTDGALGVRFEVGDGLFLDLWHMDRVDIPQTGWTNVGKGQIVGVTGNTGALVNGKPMAAHTHIELWDHGVRIDPEPFLVMAERPAQPLPEDDMQIKGDNLRHIQNRSARVTTDSSFRAGPSTSDTRIDVLNQGALLFPICVVTGQKVGTAQDATEWFGCIKTAGVQGNQFGFIHSSVLPRSKDGKGVALELVESGYTTEDMANALVQGRAQMKRDIENAIGKVAA